MWGLLIAHVEGRRAALPKNVVERVIADMRAREAGGQASDGVPRPPDKGRDHLVDAYQTALDFAAHLAAELDGHGAAPDGQIDIRDRNNLRLVRVQSMLWDNVLKIVQLRTMIEERTA